MSLSIRSETVDLFSGTVPMDRNYESAVLDLRGANGFAIELFWENGFDPVGTFTVLVSSGGANFIPVWSSSVASDSGSDGLDYLATNWAYAKVTFEYTSGSDAVMSGSATIKRY